MKLKIAICDDEQNQIEYLSGVVSAWANKSRHVAELKTYSSAKSFLFDYSEEKDFDILLLDIEMPGMTGVDLAKTPPFRSFSLRDITNISATALTCRLSTILSSLPTKESFCPFLTVR